MIAIDQASLAVVSRRLFGRTAMMIWKWGHRFGGLHGFPSKTVGQVLQM
jgi:hypothetical protein